MKKYTHTILAGLIGGMVVAASMLMLQQPTESIIHNTPLSQPQVVHATLTSAIGSVDFRKAAIRSTPTVVQIYAAETAEQVQRRNSQRRGRGSFFDFFGDDFFGYGGGRPKNGSGSGVILSQDGYIVTNNHVVGFADNIKVTLDDGKQYAAEKIGVDPVTDLAVIKIEGSDLPTISYGDSDDIQIGEWVLAVGNPFSYLTSTVTAGIVSAKGRDLDIIDGGQGIVEFIQTDAAVNPGNSGGALVNTNGDLVGINTAIATPTGVYAGYSFAIPSNLVRSIVSSLIENGDIRGNRLGIEGYDVDRSLVIEYDLKTNSGFMVVQMEQDGNASKAGLKEGDVIVGLNRKEIFDFDDLQDAMAITTIGEVIDIEVERDGKNMTLNVRLSKNKK